MQRIKEFFQTLKVGTKLSVGIITIVFLLMAVTLTVVINSYRNHLINNSKKLMATELELIVEGLDAEMGSMTALAESLASGQETGVFGDRKRTVDVMRDYLDRFPTIQAAYVNLEPNADGQDSLYVNDTVHCRDGRFVPYASWVDPLVKALVRIRPTSAGAFTYEWYTGPQKAYREFSGTGSRAGHKMVTITEPYITKEGEPVTSVTVPVIIDGQFKGVAGIDRSLVAYSGKLAALKPYKSANALLVSRDQILIASGARSKEYIGKPITKLEGYGEDFFSIFKNPKDGIRRAYRARDNSYAFYIYQVSPKTGWTVAMSVSEAEVLRPINTIIMEISVGAVVALILSIGFVLGLSNRIVMRPVRGIMELFSEIGMGNFDARAEILSHDELGVMAESLNAMLDNTLSLIQSREERDAIQDTVMKLLEEISGLTEGDLTVRAEVTEDMTGAIADSFNLMAEQIGRVVQDVKVAAGSVTVTSGEVHESTEKLAETSTQQASQIAAAIQSINLMADTIRTVAGSAVQSAAVSEKSTVNAKEGAEAVNKTNESMSAIRENVQETARAIKRLGESSQEIGNIVQIIGDIADRTSILALNASIQAAMAGDAGRGFAVVAEEVQRLAERSTNSTKQIDTLVKNIQGEITEAGASMDASIQRVVEGAQRADDAHTKLEDIQHVSGELAELIGSISRTSEAQAMESEKITRAMEAIGTISSDTSEASLATAARMNEMEETAQTMMDSIAAFKVE
ncbi:methyl-accepting chemotaxis protein [Desulfoluna sp.]|uniref:methyl-accepting chemotaxis protein n=1 Tax=Desulfoluna sp. TaxID=2045199 RepID=UPI00261F2676|nr:methyl-accepting chemotaxis protein [Desulfoluna sp.]